MPPKAVPPAVATGNAATRRFNPKQYARVLDTVEGADKLKDHKQVPRNIPPGTVVEILDEEIHNPSADSSMLGGAVVESDTYYLYRLQIDLGKTWIETVPGISVDNRVAKIPHKYLASTPNGTPSAKFYEQRKWLYYNGPRDIIVNIGDKTMRVKNGDKIIIAGPPETATSGTHGKISPQNAYYAFQMTDKVEHRCIWKSYNRILGSRLVPA